MGDADVLAFRVLLWVFVVLYVARFGGVNRMVAAHGAVVAGEPVGASLAEDYVSRDNILFCNSVSISFQKLELGGIERGNKPPDLLAPNLFPGPSLALFTAPC